MSVTPFKSKKQAAYMFATMPDEAEVWAKHTTKMGSLPKYAHGNKSTSPEKAKRRKK